MVSWMSIIGIGDREGQWYSKGGGGIRFCAGLWAHQHTFSSIFNAFLSRINST